MTDIRDRYARLAATFSEVVDAVPAGDVRWEQQSPCPDWKALDVVRHVVEAHQIFFGLAEHDVPEPPDDPLRAWPVVRDAMAAALDDPAVARREYTGQMGTAVWEQSVDRFVSGDLLVHTWDLARALGRDVELPAAEVRRVREAFGSIGDAMRQPGAFGPEVDPPSGADEQDRLLAFLGRDPRWSPS
jgi:uncharacterized protein (TIGR03086 family)